MYKPNISDFGEFLGDVKVYGVMSLAAITTSAPLIYEKLHNCGTSSPLVKRMLIYLPYGCSHATGHPGEGADLITCGGGDGGLTVGTLHLDPELPEHHVVHEARLGDHNRRIPSYDKTFILVLCGKGYCSLRQRRQSELRGKAHVL